MTANLARAYLTTSVRILGMVLLGPSSGSDQTELEVSAGAVVSSDAPLQARWLLAEPFSFWS